MAVTFIDFELGGPNYRGFDIFKLFRRGQIKEGGDGQPEPMSHDNLRHFVGAYLDAVEQNRKQKAAGWTTKKKTKKTNKSTTTTSSSSSRSGGSGEGGLGDDCVEEDPSAENNLTFEQKTATLACIAAGVSPDDLTGDEELLFENGGYSMEGGAGGGGGEGAGSQRSSARLEAVLAEVYLFEPLTWLEAAVFFLFAIQEDQENMDAWAKLAVHRWENYERSKSSIQVHSEALLRATTPPSFAAAG